MSWSRALVITTLLLTLSSCGFAPLHARGGGNTFLSAANIDIGNIPDRDGQYLKNLLIDRLHISKDGSNPLYHLDLTPLEKESFNIGIRKDASVSRSQMEIRTVLKLVEKNTGKVLLERKMKAVGSYNVLDNQLSTLVSKENVTDSMLKELSEDIVRELNLYFRRQET